MAGDAPAFVLVHSPLVGPATWRQVAAELALAGRIAVVPDLTGVAHARAPQWHHVPRTVASAVKDLHDGFVLVAHSGAGLLVPAITDAVAGEAVAVVFADAFLPPTAGETTLLPAELLSELRELATGGVLPPWSRWFGEDALRELVPGDALRTELAAEMPRLPLGYFDGRPVAAAGWENRAPCAYLLLSRDPYGPAAEEARRRGWPVAELPGGDHLSAVTRPAEVTSLILDLARPAGRRDG